MNPPAVIVPVKSAARKSRLSGLLDGPEREEFARLLLADVLRVLGRAGLIRLCHVVSPDERMLDLAARKGARTVREPGDDGVNSAVSRGLGAVQGASQVLVIPADLPLLRPSELLRLARAMSTGADVGIAPSRGFDGTNALAFAGPPRFPLRYDDDSFWNHLSGAAREGLAVHVCTEEGLMFDVDSPDDFRALAGSRSKRPSAAFARRVLR